MPRYECRVARIDVDITTHWLLSQMAWASTKLYNTALWDARMRWERTGKIPSGFDLQKVVLASPYHSYLPAHTYQHPAHQVWNAFRAWFKLRKKDKTAHPPGFRPKAMPSTFMVDAFKAIDGNTVQITLGPSLREKLSYPDKRLTLHLNWNTPFPADGKIVQMDIVPKEGYFECHAKITLPEPVWRLEGDVKTIDLGQRNPVVMAGENGTDIFKGGAILATLHYWNKEKARVQSQIMERPGGKRHWSKHLQRMSSRGNHQVKQTVHSLSATIAEMCDKDGTKEVVVGDLGGIKKEKNGQGKRWNDKSSQNWQQFPVRTLVAQLGYKLARHGIRLSEQDERGTSRGRCSLCGCMDRSKLHRVHRGLFHCEECHAYQNADENGAWNQRARYLHQEDKPSMGSSGRLASPRVWRWDNHRWVVA